MFLHRAKKALQRQRGHQGYEQFGAEFDQWHPPAKGKSGIQGFTWNSFLSGFLIGIVHKGGVQPTSQRFTK